MSKLDYLVYAGRFQPFHQGHLETLKTALDTAKQVIILLGSSNRAPTIRNPFNAMQRANMISLACREAGLPLQRIITVPINDYPYQDNKWVQNVQDTVGGLTAGSSEDPTIGIIGFARDHTSYYLDLFPQWEKIESPEVGNINATNIRNSFFSGFMSSNQEDVPTSIVQWMQDFATGYPEEYARLQREYKHIASYRKQWTNVPYPVIFTTADAVVIQSGHILLVQRDAQPGEGQWALPGGFVNAKERIVDAMIRELREETRLKVPEAVLRGSIKAQGVFDDPERSLRGRTITHAFCIELKPGELPAVKGGDDARKARWFSLSEFAKMETRIFEDHFSIAQKLIGEI